MDRARCHLCYHSGHWLTLSSGTVREAKNEHSSTSRGISRSHVADGHSQKFSRTDSQNMEGRLGKGRLELLE